MDIVSWTQTWIAIQKHHIECLFKLNGPTESMWVFNFGSFYHQKSYRMHLQDHLKRNKITESVLPEQTGTAQVIGQTELDWTESF